MFHLLTLLKVHHTLYAGSEGVRRCGSPGPPGQPTNSTLRGSQQIWVLWTLQLRETVPLCGTRCPLHQRWEQSGELPIVLLLQRLI